MLRVFAIVESDKWINPKNNGMVGGRYARMRTSNVGI